MNDLLNCCKEAMGLDEENTNKNKVHKDSSYFIKSLTINTHASYWQKKMKNLEKWVIC